MSPRILILEVGAGLALALVLMSFYGLTLAGPGALSVEPPYLWVGMVLGAMNFIASVRGLRLARRERRDARLYAELDRASRA